MMKRWVCGGMKKRKREGCCIKWDLFHYLPWMRVKLLHTSTSLGYLWVPHGSKGPLILPFHSPPQHLRVCMCVYIHIPDKLMLEYIHPCVYIPVSSNHISEAWATERWGVGREWLTWYGILWNALATILASSVSPTRNLFTIPNCPWDAPRERPNQRRQRWVDGWCRTQPQPRWRKDNSHALFS